jgi:hypothetical protein
MWIFTTHGDRNHADRVVVCARAKEHLERLINFHPELAGISVAESGATDYRYRIFVEKPPIKCSEIKSMVRRGSHRTACGAIDNTPFLC